MLLYDDNLSICQSISSDATTTTKTFFDLMMNDGYKQILAALGLSSFERTRTASTVANQDSYQVPPDFLWMKTLTVTVGSTTYPLIEVDSQERWDAMHQITRTSTIPTHFFMRQRFGLVGDELVIYPTPSASSNTINMVYAASDKDKGIAKYTTGTVTVENGSATVTGSGASWTNAMVGRYLIITDAAGDGFLYRVQTVSSSTEIILENYYDGIDLTGVNYTIGESFNLPEGLQILPSYWALAHYFAGKQNSKDFDKYLNIFTALLEVNKRRYSKRSTSNKIRTTRIRHGNYPNNFPQTITGS